MNFKILKSKSGNWLLKPYEKKLKDFLAPKVPRWIETYHLTWLTVLWSLLVVLCFYLGKDENTFVLLVPLFVALQYFTDLLDGEVGRRRNTGLVRWGYYVDHFLDFVFMSSIIFGYAILVGFDVWIFTLFAAACGYHVSTYLRVGVQNSFHISFLGIGPTEARILFIAFHLIIAYKNIHLLNLFMPYIAAFSVVSLLILFFTNQHVLWKEELPNPLKK